MMGQHARSESLFYYFRLEDQVSENHLLRLVDKHIDFGFVREALKLFCRELANGRPAVPKVYRESPDLNTEFRIEWRSNQRGAYPVCAGTVPQHAPVVRV